jgi:hypothetical protein
MDVSWAFEVDRGFRFRLGQRSILLSGMSIGNALSRRQRLSLATHMARLFAGIANQSFPANPVGGELAVQDFPQVSGTAFKIVPRDVELLLRNGQFKVGSPAFYAGLPNNDPAQDWWEGYSAFSATSGNKCFNAQVVAGFNALAFCTTRARDHRQLVDLKARFYGAESRLVKIVDIEGFADALATALGASEAEVRDVRYRDAKVLHFPGKDLTLLQSLIYWPSEPSISDEMMDVIGRCLWSECFDTAMLASSFCKPVSYSVEQERRILFRFDEDIPSPYFRIFHAPDAVQFLKFEGEY